MPPGGAIANIDRVGARLSHIAFSEYIFGILGRIRHTTVNGDVRYHLRIAQLAVQWLLPTSTVDQ